MDTSKYTMVWALGMFNEHSLYQGARKRKREEQGRERSKEEGGAREKEKWRIEQAKRANGLPKKRTNL